MSRPAKGHVGRQRKLECSQCGFIAYASGGAITTVGVPTCACGAPMVVANLRDLLDLGMVDAAEVSTSELRALGYTDIPRAKSRNARRWRICCERDCDKRCAAGRQHCEEHLPERMPF